MIATLGLSFFEDRATLTAALFFHRNPESFIQFIHNNNVILSDERTVVFSPQNFDGSGKELLWAIFLSLTQ